MDFNSDFTRPHPDDPDLTIHPNWRLYVWVNRALSMPQKAVQGIHAAVELFVPSEGFPYPVYDDPHHYTLTWGREHKTLVLLEGGFHQQMIANYRELQGLCKNNDLPCAVFYEDEETLNGVCTAFACVVPSPVYEMEIDEDLEGWIDIAPANTPEVEMARLKMFLSSFSLVRG